MGELRHFLRARHLLVAGLIAFALAMKVLVPAGYMFNPGATGALLVICPNANPGMNLDHRPDAHAVHAAHHGDGMVHDAHHDGDGHGDHGSDNTCPYSLMPMASLSGVDGVLLAVALVFILALGFARLACPRLVPAPYLRPPLRGPPGMPV